MSLKIQKIIKKAGNGDKDSASELIDIYSHQVYSYLRRLCGNNEDAEDLTQQTFIKVWSSLSGFKGNSAFTTWIYRIAYNIYVDWLRGKKINLQQDVPWKWIDNNPSPADLASDKQMAEHIYKTVNQLDDDKKQVVHLHYYQGLSIRETAKVLNIATSTVKYRIREALKFIKSEITEKDFNYADKNKFYIEKGDLL